MKIEIKPRDRKLLTAACFVLIMVLMLRLVILPAIDAYEIRKIEYEEKDAKAQEMQRVLDSRSANEERISQEEARLEELSGSCYEVMENRQVDELVTGAALAHNLFPFRLSISEQTAGIAAPYLYGADQAVTDSEAKKEEEDEKAAEELEESAVRRVEASIAMNGSEDNMKAFLNDIEENYPAVHVKSFEMSENMYLNTELMPVAEIQMSVVLEIYMYTISTDPKEQ